MNVIDVPPGERGVVRVFALSMDDQDAKALRANEPPEGDGGPRPVEAALGVSDIDTDFVEVFALSDIREIGLDGYLEDGNGIEPAQLAPDRGKLTALEGWVMVVYSAAFGGKGAEVRPAPDLTLVGTYSEPGVDWSDRSRLTTAGAEGTVAPAETKPSDAAMSGRIAMIALLVMFLLTALVIWIAA